MILYNESKHNKYPCLGRQGQQRESGLPWWSWSNNGRECDHVEGPHSSS